MKKTIRHQHTRITEGRVIPVRQHYMNISTPILRLNGEKYVLDMKKNRLRHIKHPTHSIGYAKAVTEASPSG